MKKFNLILSAGMLILMCVASYAASTPGIQESIVLSNTFSFTEYSLLGLCVILLIIIWTMSKTINSLSVKLQREYNSDDYL